MNREEILDNLYNCLSHSCDILDKEKKFISSTLDLILDDKGIKDYDNIINKDDLLYELIIPHISYTLGLSKGSITKFVEDQRKKSIKIIK